MSEKLQKVLARAGFGSRRLMETWIEAGRVTVNGSPARLGDRVGAEADIRVDGQQVSLQQRQEDRTRVLIYHKPEGEVCSRSDPEGRPTVFDRLPRLGIGRWISVGRLDVNTSGLLLLTNDGTLANRMMHPSSGLEREYAVRVLGLPGPEALQRLVQGVELEDGSARFERLMEAGGSGANRWYHVILTEGRKREVRRLWEAVGATVSRLIRVRYGALKLPPRLRPGRWEELEAPAVAALRAQIGMAAEAPAAPPRSSRRRSGPARGQHVRRR